MYKNKTLRIFILFIIIFSQKFNLFSQKNITDSLSESVNFHAEIIDLWLINKPAIENLIKNSKFDTYNLYNVQISSNIILKYAFNHKNYILADDILATYMLSLNTLDTLKKYKFYYFFDGKKPSSSLLNLENEYLLWVDGTNKNLPEAEDILSSSQFLSLISEAVFNISQIDKLQRTKTMTDFVLKFSPILNSHYFRWVSGINVKNPKTAEVFTEKGPFQRRGWNCKYNDVDIPSGLTHYKLLQLLYENKCGNNTSKNYCNAVTDIDLFIIEGVGNYCAAWIADSLLLKKPDNFNFYKTKYLPLANKLVKSRITSTKLKNFEGKFVEGYVFDANKFDDHPDNAYSGFSDAKKYPNKSQAIRANGIGWDISHARRYVNIFDYLLETKNLLNLNFPDTSDLKKFANQFAYGIFNKDLQFPLFTNYFSGSNGWYRVGYSNRKNFGYGPYDMSMSAITGGYGIWSKYNSDIQLIMTSLYKMIHSADSAVKTHLNNHYEKYVWTNNKITNKPQREQAYYFEFDSISSLNSATQNALISFYPSILNNNNSNDYFFEAESNIWINANYETKKNDNTLTL